MVEKQNSVFHLANEGNSCLFQAFFFYKDLSVQSLAKFHIKCIISSLPYPSVIYSSQRVPVFARMGHISGHPQYPG